MKALFWFVLILLSVSVVSAEPFVVIVRHAEKATNDDKDPDLSSAGLARADALSQMLKDSGITSIFTSEFKRTQQTAAATAKALAINPTVVPGKDTSGLVAKLHDVKGNALVVGHGNTIPDLVKALGIDAKVNIQEKDYDQFFVVELGNTPALFRLRYPNNLTKGDSKTKEEGK